MVVLGPIAAAILGAGAALGVPATALGAAAAAGPAAIVGTAIGAPAAAGAVAGSVGVGGAVAADPHARLGVQNGLNDAYNNAAQGATDAYNQGVDAWNNQAVPELNGAGSTGAGPVPHANFGG